MLTKNKCSQYLIDSLSRRQNDDDDNDDSNSQFGNQTMHTHQVIYEKKKKSLYQIMRKIWFYQNKIPSDVIPSQYTCYVERKKKKIYIHNMVRDTKKLPNTQISLKLVKKEVSVTLEL